ncbi:16681_t:CDS:2, partial [Acaulospora colombiana]
MRHFFKAQTLKHLSYFRTRKNANYSTTTKKETLTPLAAQLRQTIKLEGPMPIKKYMQEALTNPKN